MNKNVLWGMVVILLITNVLTFALWKADHSKETSSSQSNLDTVAKVGNTEVTYDELVGRMESLYGKETLTEIINEEVINQLAEKEGISISEEEIDREMMLINATFNEGIDESTFNNKGEWREEIRYLSLLEELLTKGVDVADNELKQYYEENKELYEIPSMYQISHITVSTLEEAKDIIKELEGGSSFSSLAMERSEDSYTASEEGNLGFISEDSQVVPPTYYETAKELDKGQWSNPVKIEEGYAIIKLNEYINGKEFSFNEVKSQIRRQMALQDMDVKYTTEPFWSEVGVEWLYGEG